MQASGLTEFIHFTCTSALWGQSSFLVHPKVAGRWLLFASPQLLSNQCWGWQHSLGHSFGSPHSHMETINHAWWCYFLFINMAGDISISQSRRVGHDWARTQLEKTNPPHSLCTFWKPKGGLWEGGTIRGKERGFEPNRKGCQVGWDFWWVNFLSLRFVFRTLHVVLSLRLPVKTQGDDVYRCPLNCLANIFLILSSIAHS